MNTQTTKGNDQTMNTKAAVALTTYLACIPAANWAINNIGTVEFPGGPHTIPVGFGYSAPSGVLLIGAALAARDAVQRLVGKRAVLAAIAVGVALSYMINPAIATASAVAFGLGELADFAVFTPLAARGRLVAAVAASGVVGGIIDTFVFLQIAFGSTMFWQGQIIGKTAMALLGGLIIWIVRAVPQRLSPVGS
jgi:queuosine precursor transporter